MDRKCCFCIISIIITPILRNSVSDPSHTTEPIVTAPYAIQDFSSKQELEKFVGFPVEELATLPFSATSTTYTAYGTELAEISYKNKEKNATFRKSIGAYDNSGNYTT